MISKEIGKYFERIINLEESIDLKGIKNIFDSGTAILLWIGTNNWEKEDFVNAIKNMLEKEVIAICVSGKRVKEQFDLLIDTQSLLSTVKHTMTYMFDDKDIESVLENLFWGVITDDERWENWKNYLLTVIGDPNAASDVKKLIKEKWNDQ